MENARIVIAIALSFVVFLLWDLWFVPKQAPQTPPPGVSSESPMESAKPEGERIEPARSAEKSGEAPSEAVVAALPARQIRIETPLYRATLSEHGAQLTSFVLKKYRQHIEASSAPLEMIDAGIVKHTLGVSLGSADSGDDNGARYVADSSAEQLAVDTGKRQLVLRRHGPKGLLIEKRFTFSAESYVIELQVAVLNQGEQAFADSLVLSLKKALPPKSTSYGFEGPSGFINGKLHEIKSEDIGKEEPPKGQVEWIGVQDRYFLEAVMPMEAASGSMQLRYDSAGYVENRLLQPLEPIAAGYEKRLDYQIYFGPKSLQVLRSVGHNLDKAVNFGFFDILAKPLLWFMNLIHGLIPNYGVAIILMTIVIKIVLWPLGSKSYRSMSEMKKIQPLMAEIREKYKDDRQRMNQEIMSLYRVYKVNPMGGCLPMLLQIPVFFALYSMLYTTIELRHAPFMGWITDLSAPDRLFDFGFKIPFMDPPFGIPVLTIIMGATMFIQQKMSPPAGDPTQAKMMMMMPIVFTVIFINFSSGLVLYWLVNNIISIAQQYYITQKS